MNDQRRALWTAGKAKTKEIRKLKRQLAQRHMVDPTLIKRGLIVWASEGGSLDSATEYILSRRKDLKNQEDELRHRLTQEWTGVSAAEHSQLRDGPFSPKARRDVESVRRWLRERSLHSWVETQNLTKGVAPLQSIALSHVDGMTVDTGSAPTYDHTPSKKHRRQWLLRWRRRWDVSLAAMPAGDVVPAELAQRKAIGLQQGSKVSPGNINLLIACLLLPAWRRPKNKK